MQPPVRIGIAGLGGYAGVVRKYLLDAQAAGAQLSPPVQLVAVCDPAPQNFPQESADLRQRGVAILDDFAKLLAMNIEAVWLPLPIDLHRPFTEQALAAGKVVMCEKPAAAVIDDWQAMVAARDRAGLPVGIGFQHVYDARTPVVKKALAGGLIGPVQRVALTACWPRADKYYQRSTWAGALKRGDTWVLDGPAGNALAHYLNLPLFLLGPAPGESALPRRVEAELYRARPIASYDTIALRLHLDGPCVMDALLTHACQRNVQPLLVFTGTNGRLEWPHKGPVVAYDAQGGIVKQWYDDDKTPQHMVQRLAAMVRGGISDPAIAWASLEVAQAPLLAVNGALEATVIHTVPASAVTPIATPDSGTQYAITGIEEAFAACAVQRQLLHESGLFPWTQPAGGKDMTGYHHFAGPKQSA